MTVKSKYKSIPEWIAIGENTLRADDEAIDEGNPWQLLPAIRAKLESKFAVFSEAATKADLSGRNYTKRVKEKRRLSKMGREAIMKLKVYIENAFLDDAKWLNHNLLLDKSYPTDDQEIGGHLASVCSAINSHDDAAYPLPASFTDPIYDIREKFRQALLDVTDYLEDRRTAVQERNKALLEFKKVLAPIRKWLYQMLPEGRYDTRLLGYGFNPYKRKRKRKMD